MTARIPLTLASATVLAFLVSLPKASVVHGQKPAVTRPSSGWTIDEALWDLRLHSRDPYLQYVVLQLARRANKVDEVAGEVHALGDLADRQHNGVDLFSAFTGALAVQECLQLDTMRGKPPAGRRNKDNDEALKDAASWKKRHSEIVQVDGLKGPVIESRPWLKMLAGRKPEIDPLAKMTPDDFYFVQFRSVSKLLEALNSTDLWATHFFNQGLQEARTTDAYDRLRKQLAVETSTVPPAFYDQAVEEVAVMGSDLFFREGNDVTLVFRVKEPKLFKAGMDGFLVKAAKSQPDAKRAEGRYLGVRYVQLTTPDRGICVFSAYPTENVHVRSNSQVALHRIIEAIQGKNADGKSVRRLGDSSEFAYIRTIHPRGVAEEDGFIYFSDPFMRHMIGPRLKLTERRRRICYNHLRMIAHAAMLYRTEHGKPPDSLETLFASQCCPAPFYAPKSSVKPEKLTRLITDLDSEQFRVRQQASAELVKLGSDAEAALRKTLERKPSLEVRLRIEELLLKLDRLCHCPSGGAYQLSADGMTGVCTHHGCAHCLTPNLEMPTTKVCGEEADEYKAFLEDYNENWKSLFAPIAVRLQMTPKRYRLETFVPSLMNNSIYSEAAKVLSGRPENLDASPVPSRGILSLGLRLNKDVVRDFLKEVLENSKELGVSIDEIWDILKKKKRLPNVLAPNSGRGLEAKNFRSAAEKFLAHGLGDQIGLHVYDHIPLVHINLSQILGLMLGGFDDEASLETIGIALLAFEAIPVVEPMYVSIPVQDAKIVDSFGGQLEELFAAYARMPLNRLFSLDYYLAPFQCDKNRAMRCLAFKVGPITLRFFYARIGGMVYITNRDFILEDLLTLEKAQKKAPAPREGNGGETTGHAMLKLRSKNWNQVQPDNLRGWAENHRQACFNNLAPLGGVARAVAPLGKIDDKERAAVEDRIRKETDRLYEGHLFCPENGRYVLGPDGKSMTCTVHGTMLAPKQPLAPDENSVLARHLEHFVDRAATVTFLKEGLRAVVVIERK